MRSRGVSRGSRGRGASSRRGGRGRGGRGRGASSSNPPRSVTVSPAPQSAPQPPSVVIPLPPEVHSTPATITITPETAVRDALTICNTVADYLLTLKSFGVESVMDTVLTLIEKKVDLTPAAKARIMTALWISKEYTSFDKLMFDIKGFFGTSELFKLVPLMDRPRRLRQIRKKVIKLGDKIKLRKRKALVIDITELQKEVHPGNLTNSFSRRVKKWVGTLTEDFLTFQAVNFPTENWRSTADLCHLNPRDFVLPWFLPFCFGAPAPEGSLVSTMMTMTTESLAANIRAFPYLADCYSMLRQKVSDGALQLTVEVCTLLAERAPMEDVVWFYEEIVLNDGTLIEAADTALFTRLANGELLSNRSQGRINYPKLMERIMVLEQNKSKCVPALMQVASEMLELITFPDNDLKVAVFGDCSSSMDVAVRAATIIASILTARLNAELSFFHDGLVMPPKQPTTASDVLQVAKAIRATRSTAPAACLYPFYERKQVVDLFLVVTDEEENTATKGFKFAKLFTEYRAKVNKHAQLFFISFLSVSDVGQMIEELREVDVNAKQFRFDKYRPDLAKFDELLGLLTLQILDEKAAMARVAKAAAKESEGVKDVRQGVEALTVEEAAAAAAAPAVEPAASEDAEWVTL